ncbi:SCO7613 C-terminal domain-containing membrane protein [Streptomyces griseosporeus]|uniref:SCO7613 C-terminal domain-containing membrane protein n=1 Tax=Streptomyces griseosporeus TaxID=1910 RepID=UPI0036F7CDAD
MTYFPPPAEELRLIDTELRQLDARRGQLLARRAWLVAVLRQAAAVPPPPAGVPHAAGFPPPRAEAAAPRVQNVLLLLGGILLTVAAIAFTLVSWGHLGIAGRALVLGGVTAAVLAAPVPLLARGLRSTGEAVAGLGFALTVLDAYALHEVAFAGAGGAGYAAVAASVLTAGWAAYGVLPRTGGLRLPLPAALAAGQLPLLLWAVAAGAGPAGIAGALLVTAACDTAVALRWAVPAVRVAAVAGAFALGGWGAVAAGWLSWTAPGPGAAARAAALLLLAAGIALAAARSVPDEEHAVGLAVTAGLFVAGAVGGAARSVLPVVWTVPAYLACGVALLAAVRLAGLPRPVRRGAALASAAVQGLAVLTAVPLVGIALLGPAAWVPRIWSGAPDGARGAVAAGVTWPPYAGTAPLVTAVVAVGLALAVRDPGRRTWALHGALGLAWATVLIVPPVLDVPYAAGLVVLGVLTAGLLFVAARTRADGSPVTALVLAVVTSVALGFGALAARPATLFALAVLAALFAAASVDQRLSPVTAPAALAHATALACAAGAAAGWAPQHTALLVLAVPATAALVAPRTGGAARIPVEVTGGAAALLAVGLAAPEPPVLALVLALCGVITAGTALRPDRRVLAYASVALFVAAAWVRLVSWDVTAPEAYTLPATVPALVVGALRRRRDARASSWAAYGPGLAVTLLPSLAAAWADAHWLRPLLLGAAALLLTLLGARHRLQAPLVLGGTVLALVTLHELAPYLVQVTDALPRWVPPALAGLLLLAVGATYERRLRDVRRVREVLGKMN